MSRQGSSRRARLFAALLLPALLLPAPVPAQNGHAALFAAMAEGLGLSPAQLQELRRIFAGSSRLGQGNPALTVHPVSEAECRRRREASGAGSAAESARRRNFTAICGAANMAPLYDPERQKPVAAPACIDVYEFPDLPCVYPVVWVKASEAAALCAAVGKRLCDAHEWEGACAGRLLPPDYPFALAEGVPDATAVARMRAAVNRVEDKAKVWSYGNAYRQGICATGGEKTPGCNGGDYAGCGSNTFPAGAFPDCRSPLGVYDLNGNAAEHMNLPLAAGQMASRGSGVLGVTEMKGSWFVFDRYRAHEDACRWRAPYWHGTRVFDARSHRNYHLGFRCCKTLAPRPPEASSPP